ncbi:MAG: 3-deoxy-7-phosphoheptulonate synthase, partial [Clostridiales bacterium]|nr:3-deoxy-7-phosphoheptulonate synthase [Clostridiales bacterium]
VHNDPIRALCDGAQSLRPEQYEEVAEKVREIRRVIGK